MPAGKRNSLLIILLMMAALAAGQTLPMITNVLQTSSAQITDFSVKAGGGAVDFFLQ